MSMLLRLYPGDTLAVYAGVVLLQWTVLLGAAILAATRLRWNPASRHCLLFAALIGVPAMPLVGTLCSHAGIQLSLVPSSVDSAALVDVAAIDALTESELPVSTDTQVDHPRATDEGDAARLGLSIGRTSPVEGITILRTAATMVFVIWVAVCLGTLVRLALALCRVRDVLQTNVVPTPPHVNRLGRGVARQLGLRQPPDMIVSRTAISPAVVGLWTPVIVLPGRHVRGLSESELRQVLLHEAAHVNRKDQVTVSMQRLLGAILWPHPLIHLLNRNLTRAREEVCDNFVLRTFDRKTYSRTLLKVAELITERTVPALNLITPRWTLTERISGLLDERRLTVHRPRPAITVTAIALIVVLLGLFGVRTPIPVVATEGGERADAASGQSIGPPVHDRTEHSPKQGEEPSATVAAIFDALKERDRTTQTLRIRWKERHLRRQEGQDIAVENENELLASGGSWRFNFSGWTYHEDLRRVVPVDRSIVWHEGRQTTLSHHKYADERLASIRPSQARTPGSMLETLAIGYAFRPLTWSRIDQDKCRLVDAGGADGEPCLLLEENVQQGDWRMFWIKRNENWTIVRYETGSVAEDTLVIRVDSRYDRRPGDAVVPVWWKAVWLDKQGDSPIDSREAVVTECRINEEVDPAEFVLRFPKGTVIADRSAGDRRGDKAKYYVVIDDAGNRREGSRREIMRLSRELNAGP